MPAVRAQRAPGRRRAAGHRDTGPPPSAPGSATPRPPERTSPGALRARWRLAFDAAAAALRAGDFCLAPQEIRRHAQLLALERAQTATLLEAFAHDQHSDAAVRHFLPVHETRRLVGLPAEIRACVFSLEGVLVGSAQVHARAWAETFDEFISQRVERTHGAFAPFRPDVDYPAHLHGRPRLDGVRAFLASRGIRLPEGAPDDPPGAETVYGLANRKNAALHGLIDRHGLAAFQGAREYLETVREAGLRTAVVSASANTETLLERAGLAGLVDVCVDGNVILEAGLRAPPEPDVLVEACRRLRAEPRLSAVFETSAAGIAAACSAGFGLVVGIDSGGAARVLRDAGADAVAPGIEEFLDQRLAA